VPRVRVVTDALLAAIENLSRFHREHERFYAQQPREQAVRVQRHSRTLSALADRWSSTAPDRRPAVNPFEGAEDLNAAEATQLDGVLFMQGEGEPAELTRLKRDLRTLGEDSVETGAWLADAMESSWQAVTALFEYPMLADLLGDRHRIIANDWQAATMSSLAGRVLLRAVDLLERLVLTPEGVRQDLESQGAIPHHLYATVELIDHAADLLSDSAGLVHDNERRWRTFRQRVLEVMRESG
jgi:hypothetical protein